MQETKVRFYQTGTFTVGNRLQKWRLQARLPDGQALLDTLRNKFHDTPLLWVRWI